jgi:predicted Zn-dependent protease
MLSRAYRPLIIAFLLTASALAGLAACATNPVTGEPDLVLMSQGEELALGREYDKEVLKQYRKLDDPPLQAYVNRIGQRLASRSHRSDIQYHFTVLDSSEVNAFALPGGYVYITRGMLAYLDTDAELAAVLGHEIGHVTARHAVRQHTTSTVIGLIGSIVSARTGSGAANDLSNVLGLAIVRGYGREHELEADRLGAEYLARSGYDPEAMLQVIRVLKAQEQYEIAAAKQEGRDANVYHGLFSTHPDNDQRLQTVIQAANSQRTRPYQSANRSGYLQQLKGLTFGPGEQDGVLRGRDFYHRPLNFTLRFPDRWRVENLPDRLVAVGPEKDSVMAVRVRPVKTGQDVRTVYGELFGSENLSSARPVQGRTPGYTGLAALRTPFGNRTGRVAVLRLGNHDFVFAAANQSNRIGDIDPQVLATQNSLRPLTTAEQRLAQPKRIQLIHVKAGDTWDSLARQSAFTYHASEQLRLLNGRFPDGRLAPGETLKTIH